MNILKIILIIIGIILLFIGGRKYMSATDSMLNRGAGFSTGDGSGMNRDEVKIFESGLKWLLVGGIILAIAIWGIN